MADNRTLSQSGSGGGAGDLTAANEQLTQECPPDVHRYLVGFETIRTLDARLPEPGRIVTTAELETLGRTAVVELPEAVVPQFTSTAGVEFVLRLDHL